MKYSIIFLLSFLMIFSSCNSNKIIVTDYQSCVDAGNPIMESYPEKCNDGVNTYTREIEPKICTREYMPVCASVQVQCIRAPCPPLNITFSNKCEARDNLILYEGECIN